MADEKTPEQELKELAVLFKTRTDDVNSWAEKLTTEVKNLGEATGETKASADKAITALNDVTARLTDVEQKIARRANAGDTIESKSVGQLVVENDELKSLMTSNSKRGRVAVSIEGKAVLSATGTWGSTASVGNSLVRPDMQGFIALPQRDLRVRDLLAQGETASNAIEYAVQQSFTNNAAVVAENTTKPVSDMVFDLESAAVRTIAHTLFASRQILDDAPMLRSFIDAQMRYGLMYAEEAEILNGDGTGQHLLGIIPQATAYSAPFAITGATIIDQLRLAILQASLALYPVDGIVLHPTDWAKVEVTKDGQGQYLVGNPLGALGPRLWNTPVVNTMAMTAGDFVVGSFKTGAQLFDRMGIEVLISTEDGDNFKKNMVTVRAEERVALAVYRPASFIEGTFA